MSHHSYKSIVNQLRADCYTDIANGNNVTSVYSHDIPVETLDFTTLDTNDTKQEKNKYNLSMLDEYAQYADILQRDDVTNTTTVNCQYISDALQAYVTAQTNILVKSDMGTGKTHWMARYIASTDHDALVIVVTHLKNLVAGIASKIDSQLAQDRIATGKPLKVAHYADVSTSQDKSTDLSDARAVFTTVNSMPRILDSAVSQNRKIAALIVDESESVANFLVSDAITNKTDVAKAMEWVDASTAKVIMMDAHLSPITSLFANAYLPSRKFCKLVNGYHRWHGVQYSWSGAVSNGKNAMTAENNGIAIIASLITHRKKLWVSTTSRAQAERIYSTLKQMGLLVGLTVMRAFEGVDGNDNDQLQAAKNDHSLFNDYDLVVASPTVGTGISIDTPYGSRPNFDRCVSFLTRHHQAPDALSAMQMPFRVRQLNDNVIHLIECDFIEHGRPLPAWEARRDLKRLVALNKDLADDFADDLEARGKYLRHYFDGYHHYRTSLDINKSLMFDAYYSVINREFVAKGMVEIEPPTVGVTDHATITVNDANRLARDSIKRAPIDAIINAPDLPPDQLEAVSAKIAYTPDDVSHADKVALDRAHLIAAYHADDTIAPTQEQIEAYVRQDEKGIATARNRMANALLSQYDIQRIRATWVKDASKRKKDATSIDALRVAANRNIDSAIACLIGLELTDCGYAITKTAISATDVTSKANGWSISRRLSDGLDAFNALNPDSRLSRKKLHDNPLDFAVSLLRKRFKLSLRAQKDGSYVVNPNQETLANLNLAYAKTGTVGLNRLLAAIKLDDALDDCGELSPDTCKRLGIDADVRSFLTASFAKIPQRLHMSTLINYLKIADTDRKKGDSFSPVARANHYIHDVIKDVIKQAKTGRAAA